MKPMKRASAGPPQALLFSFNADVPLGADPDAPPVDSAPSTAAPTPFLDPSPHLLYAGTRPLHAYLTSLGHHEVFLLRLIVCELDLQPLLDTYSHRGRPPHHPALMISLILYATLHGHTSTREIEAFAQCDLRAWWLTGGACPDHSTISKFLTRHAEFLSEQFFVRLTKKLFDALGSKPPVDLAFDGTTVAAAARRYRLLTEQAARQKATEAREEAAQAKDEPTRSKALRRAEKLEAAAEEAARRTEQSVRLEGKNRATKAKVSESEPEAVRQKLKDGTFAPSYKPVIAANPERLITGVTVVPSNENTGVEAVLDQSKEIAGGLDAERVRADSGFFNGELLERLERRGVEALIPDQAEGRKKSGKAKFSAQHDFEFDAERNVYKCPAGAELKLLSKGKVQRRLYGGAPCEGCELRGGCTEAKDGRTIRRDEHAEVRERTRARLKEEGQREVYNERAGMVEPPFSELRGRQGFMRFRRFGLRGALLETVLQAVAYNFGVAYRMLRRRGVLEGVLALLCWLKQLCEARRGPQEGLRGELLIAA